jgi:tRNA modification GTPase
MNIGGYAVTLLDTAGLHEARDVVERMGIERALVRARAADLRVFLLSQVGEALPLGVVEGDIVVLGKGDLRSVGMQSVSGRTGLGIDALLGQIAQELDRRSASAGLFTRARHKESLRAAIVALTPLAGMGRAGVELMAFQLREALQALEVLLGRVGVEDVLADIYSRFCVGK